MALSARRLVASEWVAAVPSLGTMARPAHTLPDPGFSVGSASDVAAALQPAAATGGSVPFVLPKCEPVPFRCVWAGLGAVELEWLTPEGFGDGSWASRQGAGAGVCGGP